MTGTAISLGVDGVNKPPVEPILSHSRMSPLRRNSLLHQGNLLHQNTHLHQGIHLHEEAHLHDEAHIHRGDGTGRKNEGRLSLNLSFQTCFPVSLRLPPARGQPVRPGRTPAPRSPHPPGKPVPSSAPRAEAEGLAESVGENVGVSSDQRGDAGNSVSNSSGAAQSGRRRFKFISNPFL